MKRIALLFPGCIGRGDSSMYVPAHVHLVKNLSQHFDLTIFSIIKPDNDTEPFLCGNARVIYVPARYNDPFWKKMAAYYKTFKGEHRRQPFQLVHGFWAYYCGFIAVILSKLFHIPNIVSLQGGETANLPEIQYGNMTHPLLRFITSYTCKTADMLIALTMFQRNGVRSLGVRRDDIAVIPFGPDEIFFSDLNRKELHSTINFLHVGGLNKVKDQVTLLQTFQIINKNVDSHLRIIGDDHLNGELQRLARNMDLSDHVEFLGYVPHNELPEQYQCADFLLHTSLHEAQAVVVAEAAASGVVVCGTNVGLLSDLSADSIVTVSARDFNGLAREVLALTHDHKRYEILRNNARKWAETHNAQWTVREYISLYNRSTT